MKYQFKVNIMTGVQSQKEVTEVLSAIEGVESVNVSLGSGNVEIISSEEIGLDVFATAVEEAGCMFVWDVEGK